MYTVNPIRLIIHRLNGNPLPSHTSSQRHIIVQFIQIRWTFMLIMLFLFYLIVLLLVFPLVSPPLKTLLLGMIVLVS